MNRCPITYKETLDRYSSAGLKRLSRNLDVLKDLDYSKTELLEEAVNRAPKMSIQGVQPKLSLVLKTGEKKFEIVDKNGLYILKPPHNIYREVPENEDLTMRLAESLGFKIPMHALIYGKDNSLSYLVKRFDRKGRNQKIALEDFAQLSNASRETKYKSSMEKVVEIVDHFCTFPAVEKIKLFEITLFNFLTGNEDMHLKNFSLITDDGKTEFSPFYDLLNTTIILGQPQEELALPIRGRKNSLNKDDLIRYLGEEICGINSKVIKTKTEIIESKIPDWKDMIDISFLSDQYKEKYTSLMNLRLAKVYS